MIAVLLSRIEIRTSQMSNHCRVVWQSPEQRASRALSPWNQCLSHLVYECVHQPGSSFGVFIGVSFNLQLPSAPGGWVGSMPQLSDHMVGLSVTSLHPELAS